MRKTEMLYQLCSNCHSDRVQQKIWVKLNGGSLDWDDDEDYYCPDCETHLEPYQAVLKTNAKIIGFQVVGIDDLDGELHPNMASASSIYNLNQANEMLEMKINDHYGFVNYRLTCIRKGDIEEPTIMFSGNLRD